MPGPRSSTLARVVATAAILAGTSVASADIIDVFPGGSIQAAIADADAGDLILVHPGTYAESIDFLGKAITVRGVAGATSTIIDAGGAGRVASFFNDEGPASVLERVTLTGGVNGDGAGVVIFDSRPTIRDCIIEANGTPGDGLGGGMYIGSVSSLVIRDCVFKENQANAGGAIWAANSSVTWVGCVFESNSANEYGAVRASGTPSDAAAFVNCRFIGNVATAFGTGAVRACGPLSLVNCLFAGNAAAAEGAAITQDCGSTTMVWSCTFADNHAGGETPAASVWAGLNGSAAAFRNSILWDNGPILFGGSPAVTVTWSDVEGGFGGTGNLDADPQFRDPAAGDFRLVPGSPCIDRGDGVALPADAGDVDGDGNTSEAIPLDLAGAPRRVDDPSAPDNGNGPAPAIDMGAFEFQPVSCPGDVDESGAVDFDDVLDVLANWGDDTWPQDIDRSGTVDFGDLLILLSNWGACG